MYGKQKVALFVCMFGQLGAVVCVEDYIFVYKCVCVALQNFKIKRLCADEHEEGAVKFVPLQPLICFPHFAWM